MVADLNAEGGQRMAQTIRFLVERGIPVMAHVGLTPQAVNALGGYGARGRSESVAGMRCTCQRSPPAATKATGEDEGLPAFVVVTPGDADAATIVTGFEVKGKGSVEAWLMRL